MDEESIEESLRKRALARRRRILLLVMWLASESAAILGFVAGYIGAIDWYLAIALFVAGMGIGLVLWWKLFIQARLAS